MSCKTVKHETNLLPNRGIFLRGTQAVDRRQERQLANRRAVKELDVVLATAAQLLASMRILLKAVNLLREPAHQA